MYPLISAEETPLLQLMRGQPVNAHVRKVTNLKDIVEATPHAHLLIREGDRFTVLKGKGMEKAKLYVRFKEGTMLRGRYDAKSDSLVFEGYVPRIYTFGLARSLIEQGDVHLVDYSWQ